MCCSYVSAQKKIVLQSPKMQYTEIHLYDEEENFLLTLPITFNLSSKNILAMMVGKDVEISPDQAVLFFSEQLLLKNFIKKNNNVSATKSFLKKNTELNTVLLPNRKISLYRPFDGGCEIVVKNAKPVFFEISSGAQSVTFYLQFYVSTSDNKYPNVLYAKCNPIEIELTLK